MPGGVGGVRSLAAGPYPDHFCVKVFEVLPLYANLR